MVEALRIAHFADLHIGMENYGRLDPDTGLNRRVMDYLDRLDDVIRHAIQRDADLVLFAGDAFRTRRPSPTDQRELAQRIRRLAEAGIPVVLLVGNHDVPVMSQRATSVEIFSTLGVPGVIVADQPAVHRVETRHGLIQVATMPYPVRQRLLSREQFRKLGQDDLDRATTEIVVGTLDRLKAQLDDGVPAILVGHFSVDGATLGSERSIMVGRDVAVPLSALSDDCWAYVALGHIHLHQDLNPGSTPPVVYAGSLERVDFGEEGQPKGFCWLEIGADGTEWEYVPLPARRFVTVRVDVREAAEPLAAIAAELSTAPLTDAVVRLIVQMAPEQEPGLRDAEIAPLLGDAFFHQINREVDRAVRDRLAGLEPQAMTPLRLLERFFASKGMEAAVFAPYLKEAQEIFSESPEV